MIIAVATDGKDVSPHFGRCQAYTMIDVADGKIKSRKQVVNPGHAPGAIPAFLHERGADKIVCGGIGTRARELFGQYGIEILAGIGGSVDEAVEKLLNGMLTGGESMCSPGAGRGYGVEKTECDHPHHM